MTERQSMKEITVEPVREGYDPLERQRDLQQTIYTRRPDTLIQHTPARTIGGLLARIRFNHEADAMEKAETLDWLPWKSWKTYDDASLDDATEKHPELLMELRFELVDRFHFMLNELLALDMTWGEFLAVFEAKQKENRRRQEEGY